MSTFGSQYKVGKATGQCAATGSPLEPGTAIIATLCEVPESDQLERKDFSAQAWEEGARPDHLFSHWQSIVPEPTTKKKILVNDDVIQDLFERLAGDDRPQRVAFRYVLALILMRKRLLRFISRDIAEDGGVETWTMMPKGAADGADPVVVQRADLADNDIQELSEQLSEILQGEF
jgi:hypothetical protein